MSFPDDEERTEIPRGGAGVSVRSVTRRTALKAVGVTLAGLPFGALPGCSDSLGADADDAGHLGEAGAAGDAATGNDAASTSDGGASGDGGTVGDAGATGDAASTQDAGATEWASGGTGAMENPASYPDPFASDAPGACALTCSMTAGPCYDASAPLRQDISEGKPGLPVRLGLRVLDADCQAIVGAAVDVWHCDALGVYSSAQVASPSFCTGGDPVALAAQWFRGQGVTDGSGVVWFHTCVPGWYPGRALHVHVTVREGADGGQDYVTTQLLLDDDLAQRICSQHPDYAARGVPDTRNDTDAVLPSGDLGPFLLATRRMDDGALLAHKTLIVTSTPTTAGC